MLSINRLKILREVATRKTLTAAADAFYMSPSAVSQQLSVLEREAGVPLLEKQGRGVRLTEAGRKLVRNSDAIFAAIETAEAELVDASKGLVGTVHMSAFPTAARGMIVPMLKYLGSAYPNLDIRLLDLEPEEAIPMLRTEELDLVVYYEWDLLPSMPSIGVRTYDLLSEQVYLALNRDHPLARENRPIAISELAEESWIVGREATSMLDLVSAATSHAGYEPITRFQTMDFEVILAAVGEGLGIGLIPPMGFVRSIPGVTFRRLADFQLHRTVKAGVRKGSETNPGISTVLTELGKAAKHMQEILHGIDRTIA